MDYGRSMRLILCSLMPLIFAACDGVVVINGKTQSMRDGVIDNCQAILFRADGHELNRRPVEAEFSVTFAVMPGEREYYAEISCEGYSIYRSEPFTSAGRLGDPPVDLGSLPLKAERQGDY